MSIQEKTEKLKGFLRNEEVVLTGLIVAVSLCSFYLGRVSMTIRDIQTAEMSAQTMHFKQEKVLEYAESSASSTQHEVLTDGGYVASKSGTKYHLPWCAGAKQIKETNKIFFATKEEAEKAGYGPASNCKGI